MARTADEVRDEVLTKHGYGRGALWPDMFSEKQWGVVETLAARCATAESRLAEVERELRNVKKYMDSCDVEQYALVQRGFSQRDKARKKLADAERDRDALRERLEKVEALIRYEFDPDVEMPLWVARVLRAARGES